MGGQCGVVTPDFLSSKGRAQNQPAGVCMCVAVLYRPLRGACDLCSPGKSPRPQRGLAGDWGGDCRAGVLSLKWMTMLEAGLRRRCVHSGALSWDHPLPHTRWRLRPQAKHMEGQLKVGS